MVRATWGNATEFNYSIFQTLHAHLNGTYLPINSKDWKNFTLPNESGHLEDDVRRAKFNIQVAFLLGETKNKTIQQQIRHEHQVHNDLIQESFHDTYNNLTLKTMMMTKWVVNNCDKKGKSKRKKTSLFF